MADKPLPIFIDGFSDFALGINSGIAPILLPKNQLSFLINGTLRGNYVTHRPGIRIMVLDYGGDSDLQSAFEDGLFQGACFYTPDSGNPGIVVLIGGRMFLIVPNATNGATVSEITVPGGGNAASNLQAWLWQSERWAIANDGISLPILYDGVSARRSLGDSPVIVATTVTDFTTPNIGDTVELEIAAPYQYSVGMPVTVDGENYTVASFRSSTSSPYRLTLRQTAKAYPQTSPPVVYADGTILRSPSGFYGFSSVNYMLPTPWAVGTITTITLSRPYTGSVGEQITVEVFFIIGNPNNVEVVAFSGNSLTFKKLAGGGGTGNILIGSIVQQNGNTWATVATAETFTSPGVGSTVDVFISAAYTGAIGDYLYPPGAPEEYIVEAFAIDPLQQYFVTLTNVDAVAGVLKAQPKQVIGIPNELPVGRMGTYGMGRNWMCLADGRSFIASDLVGSSSGTAAFNFRDAVLNVTQNNFLAGGGVFIIPGTIGNITAMTFTATLDSSLGQGALQVGTSGTMFSCYTPLDNITWQNLDNPILTESLIGIGPLGQNSTVLANSDTLFRSNVGLGSLILARREFSTWGNVPISREVQRIMVRDNVSLLQYGSGINFKNRLLETTKPEQSTGGVFHQGIVALNFDPISSLGNKSQSVYDGLWLGINALQLLTGKVNNTDRAFAIAFNRSTNKIELYEILDDDEVFSDNNGEDVPITWLFETACLFKESKGKGEFDPVKLIDGEMFVSDVRGRVTFQIQYRSQFDPCWHDWTAFSICAETSETNTDVRRQNRTELGFGKPPASDCDSTNNRPNFVGESFQLRIKITGHCKVYGIVIKASLEPKSFFARAVCESQACRLLECTLEDDYDVYQMQDRNTGPVEPDQFFNQTVTYTLPPCDGFWQFTGTLPNWVSFDGVDTFTGASGTFAETTQLDANQFAQNSLNTFVASQLTDLFLQCVNTCSVLPTETLNTAVASSSAIAFSDGGTLACVVIDNGVTCTFDTYDCSAAGFASVGSLSAGVASRPWVIGSINLSGTRFWIGFSSIQQQWKKMVYDPISLVTDVASTVTGGASIVKSIACNSTTGFAYAISNLNIAQLNVSTAAEGVVIAPGGNPTFHGQIAVDENLDRVLVLARTGTGACYVSVRQGSDLTEITQLALPVTPTWPVGIAFSNDLNKFAVAANDGNADGGDVVYIYNNYALEATIRLATAYWTSTQTYAGSASYNATTRQACFVVTRTAPTVGGMRFICLVDNTSVGFVDTTAIARMSNTTVDDLNNRPIGSGFSRVQGFTY